MSQSERGSQGFKSVMQNIVLVTVHNPLHFVMIVHETVQCDVAVGNAVHSVVTICTALHCTAMFSSAVQVAVMMVSCSALLH
jgi:hypothetical protein